MICLIRTDSSTRIGTGHVMRCLVLADELQRQGADVMFICREFEGNLCGYIEKRGHVVCRLPMSVFPEKGAEIGFKDAGKVGPGWQTDAEQTTQIVKGLKSVPEWLIVDHYGLDKRWEEYVTPYVNKVMVIDDLADRSHHCDLLVDQNYYDNFEDRYNGLVPPRCKKLLGPKYVLLRPGFREARKRTRTRDGRVKRIMIFFGGSDSTNETGKVLKAIHRLNRPDIAVDVVIGANNPHSNVIEQTASELPDCTCHFKVEHMAGLMAEAELAIGAGGTNVWERCVLGLPGLVATVADNQEQTVSHMAESGCLLFLGRAETVSADSFYHALEVAIKSPWLLKSFARKTRALVDGMGTGRVVLEMMPHGITLRAASMDDCEAMYKWRNSEETRRYIFNSKVIPFDEHRKWFLDSLKMPDRKILIADLQGTAVGVLRYDIEGNEAVISVYTVPGTGYYGIGTQIIRTGSDWLCRQCPDVRSIRAAVIPENEVSRNAFMKAGYNAHHIIYEKVL